MTDIMALQRLLTWLSPAFPVGAFAYSAGLESAISSNVVHDEVTTKNWLQANLTDGAARNDATIVAAAHDNFASELKLQELSELCVALTSARQRVAELHTIGDAFIEAARAWPNRHQVDLPSPCAYPVAIGYFTAAHNISKKDAIIGFLTAYCHAQVSVAVRLVPIGQTNGLHIIAELEETIAQCAARATTSTLDDIGSIGYASEIASMAHETQHSRIFRS